MPLYTVLPFFGRKKTMSLFFPEFFESNEYFIDEKVNFFKFHNEYKVYDGMGLHVGAVTQKVSGWHKVLRLFLNKAMFPFLLNVTDTNGKALASIHRGCSHSSDVLLQSWSIHIDPRLRLTLA